MSGFLHWTSLTAQQDYVYLITPNIWPFNKRYKGFVAPFYGLHDRVPILLTVILGLQHALTMIGSIVSPPLAIAGRAFNFEPKMTEYLVSTAFITTGVVTALQVTRLHIAKSPFFIGTGLLSVVGPTFDLLPIVFSFTETSYISGTCQVADDGTQLPCPNAWGAVLETMLCTVWIQILMSLSRQRHLTASSQS
jgi:xanthine/uracil permease